jgi:hypothetical protein
MNNQGAKTMKYLCLVYVEPQAIPSLSDTEKAILNRDSIAYDQELTRTGHYIVSNALEPTTTARTIRVRRGKAITTDGPFAETKEVLGGFILINASNMDEAVEIAKKIPMAKHGTIEVRPIFKITTNP